MVKKLLIVGIPLLLITLTIGYYWKYDFLSALFGQAVVILYMLADVLYDNIADRNKFKKEQ